MLSDKRYLPAWKFFIFSLTGFTPVKQKQKMVSLGRLDLMDLLLFAFPDERQKENPAAPEANRGLWKITPIRCKVNQAKKIQFEMPNFIHRKFC